MSLLIGNLTLNYEYFYVQNLIPSVSLVLAIYNYYYYDYDYDYDC